LSLPSPYHFTDDQLRVVLEPSWRQFFKDHYSVLMGNTRYQLIRFWQRRNPNVTGIVEKLDAPSNRDLGNAKKFFGAVRERLRARGPRRANPSLVVGLTHTFMDQLLGLALNALRHFYSGC
jgi:hypothetical protein